MTVFKHPRGQTWRYDFWFQGRRYTGNTRQITKTDAQLAEREIQIRLRHEAGGIAQFFPQETPRFQDWAETFLAHKRRTIVRPDHVTAVMRVLLRFWGTEPPPTDTPDEEAPRHNLRLGDPIAQPRWILDFEAWMQRRGIGPQSRNHYRGILRRLYTLAMQPAYRAVTGVTLNPFAGVPTEPTIERTVALEPADVARWLAHASYHVRLASAIAALAPKLRLQGVLGLQWGVHFDPDPRLTHFNPRVPHYIVVTKHKTVRTTGRPQAMPISQQLLRILKDAYRRQPRSAHVVLYQGRPIHSIHDGVKAAAEAAGITYGRAVEGGATFHTLRHTAATLLALTEDDPLKLQDLMGHRDLRTTLKYRHLKPRHERPAIERLSRTLKLATVVTGLPNRPRRNVGLVQDQPKPQSRKHQQISTKKNRGRKPH